MLYFLVLKVLLIQEVMMRYFLKKTSLKKGEYLQIYISEYRRGIGSRNRCFRSIGYVSELKDKGIKDPVAHYQEQVKRMNDELNEKEASDRARKVGKQAPKRYAGYFLLKGVAGSLSFFEKAVRKLSGERQFQYDVYDLMMALVYSRATFPASKRKTHEEIIPLLFEKMDEASYSQVLSCCEYIGSEYEKLVSFLTGSVKKTFGINTSETYFDCTNFYFEIDKEDEFRKKGPSKENRHDPIVGMGLLLDRNQIPIGMKLYPGNESEQPKIREVISGLKKENSITGRTIQVADKGLNCARNIHDAINRNDGYIFSRSLKKMADRDAEWFKGLDIGTWEVVYENDENGKKTEKYRYFSFTEDFDYDYKDDSGQTVRFKATEKRILTFNPRLRMKKILEINRMVDKAQRLCLYNAKKDEFGECGKFVSFVTDSGKKAKAVLDEEAIEKERMFAGFNMLVTSETHLSDRTVYGTYHNLWRIEQTFRMMKSFLDARPVYVSTLNKIKGHFLICYIGVVLERLLEFHVLGSSFCHEKIMAFIHDFSLVRMDSKDYINLLTSNDEVGQFLEKYLCPEVTNYIITPADITKLFKLKLNKRIDCFGSV